MKINMVKSDLAERTWFGSYGFLKYTNVLFAVRVMRCETTLITRDQICYTIPCSLYKKLSDWLNQ